MSQYSIILLMLSSTVHSISFNHVLYYQRILRLRGSIFHLRVKGGNPTSQNNFFSLQNVTEREADKITRSYFKLQTCLKRRSLWAFGSIDRSRTIQDNLSHPSDIRKKLSFWVSLFSIGIDPSVLKWNATSSANAILTYQTEHLKILLIFLQLYFGWVNSHL